MKRRNPTAMIPPAVLAAARKAHEELTAAGIPHRIIGGMAYGAYAPPRMTGDVDFLIPLSALGKVGGRPLDDAVVVGRTVAVLVDVDGERTEVDVDFVTAGRHRNVLESMLTAKATVVDGLPYIPLEGLLVTKLDAGRQKDNADVTEILKDMLRREGDGSPTLKNLRAWLKRFTPRLVEGFDDALVIAGLELRGEHRRR